MTANIVKHESNEGLEIYIDTQTGETFTSVNGYARMTGRAKSTISERLKGVRSEHKKMAEVPTAGGVQGVRLIDEGLIVDWLFQDNVQLAKTFTKAGVRVMMQKLAGYKHPSLNKMSDDPYVLAATRVKEIEANVRNAATRHLLIDKALHAVGLKLPQLPPAPVTYEMTVCEIRDHLKLKPSLRRSNSKMAAAIQRALDAWGCKSWWASLDAATKTYEVTDADLKMLQAVTCVQNWINEDFSQMKLKFQQLELGLAA